MKFLIIGLGSMGKRRIRNLLHLKVGEIIGFDVREDRRREVQEKYGIETFSNLDSALKQEPNALIISTPPDRHVEYALMAVEHNKHFFMEASVVSNDLELLIEKCRNRNLVAAPSCTMRYHPIVKIVAKMVRENKIGRLMSFLYHSGQYLPDWHLWEDYRNYYVSQKETGGCREIVPFELVWLTWMFGDIKCVSAMKRKLSDLETDIDDAYQILLEFSNNVIGSLFVDVISRVPFRQFKALGSDGVILADWGAKQVKLYTNGQWQEVSVNVGAVESGYIHGEQMYIEEMQDFIRAIKGEQEYGYTLKDDLNILRILEAIERSSDTGAHVDL